MNTTDDATPVPQENKPESGTAMLIRVARKLEKTQARNPIVSAQAIGPRTARVKAVLRKYGFSA